MLLYALGLALWETVCWSQRVDARRRMYAAAKRHAEALRLPLIVVGAPDRGATQGPGCGDLTIDQERSACESSVQWDITKPMPLASNSAVIFVSCVLEYVDDFPSAWNELQRIAPGRVYVCRVQPWSLAAYLYPGARRTIDSQYLTP